MQDIFIKIPPEPLRSLRLCGEKFLLTTETQRAQRRKSDRYPSEIPSCYTVVNIKPDHNSNEIAQMK
ncbi:MULTISPECIES: hypothetical protein [unclassified Nostoc]|uniref:hypothetical protein n=1 Tax=unclassified Nostoc TaxID=2593658 RepID=UPI0025E107FE|nr:hypothetical protein [Nostoc sp. JL33]MBN3873743.1 hypothetical protein [Nostoc sp. JL33]